MNKPTPVVSRAAPHMPSLPDPIMADGEDFEEPIVQGDYYSADQMRAYALSALAFRDARDSLSPLTEDECMSQQYTLRAMGMFYGAEHAWDHLDRDACLLGADEIKRLRAALASLQAASKD